jgi:hypothetical protein
VKIVGIREVPVKAPGQDCADGRLAGTGHTHDDEDQGENSGRPWGSMPVTSAYFPAGDAADGLAAREAGAQSGPPKANEQRRKWRRAASRSGIPMDELGIASSVPNSQTLIAARCTIAGRGKAA